ncbi:MAG: helix-turn-helix transcriptional regulator [Oscillospiraceae bacterium]|nr:helix-turn-helix transcriptional regulator [Oscillospiraceae bacterium]
MTRKRNNVFIDLNFPERLKQILTETNTTQQELADILGVQRQTVSLYVNGQIRPDIGALSAIGQHFDITTDWLLGLTSDRKKRPIATDELGLSEESVAKIKWYSNDDYFKETRVFSSLDAIISHCDFEELLQTLDHAIRLCSETLRAHSCGETETAGEKAALHAADELEGTRWTVITSAKYAQYLVFASQQLFNRIVSDISDVESIDGIMEY